MHAIVSGHLFELVKLSDCSIIFFSFQGCFRQNLTVVTIYASLGEDALVHSLNEVLWIWCTLFFFWRGGFFLCLYTVNYAITFVYALHLT
jgi:hypothetical protein